MSCSSQKLLNELDVSLLSVLLGGALSGVPSVPLGLALEVEHAWSVGVHVTNLALLEERVDLELLVVGE